MEIRTISEQEWNELSFWQRVNRRAVGFLVVTGGLLLVLFLPVILAVLGDLLFGDAGAIAGIILSFIGWVWLAAVFIEGVR